MGKQRKALTEESTGDDDDGGGAVTSSGVLGLIKNQLFTLLV